jgi:hypothetical protein
MYQQRDVRPSRNAAHLTYERVEIETSGCRTLHSSAGGKEMYFLSRP